MVIAGADPIATAAVALGIARVHSLRRRVALGDMIGDVAPLRALLTSDDTHGITDSFLYGISLNKIAQQADDAGNLYILPSGSESPARAEIFSNDRWRRLAAGFHEVGALMLLAAPIEAPALRALVAQLDGLVIVGDAQNPIPNRAPLAFASLARERTPETSLEMPEIAAPSRARAWGIGLLTVAVIAAAVLAAKIGYVRWLEPSARARMAQADSVARRDSIARVVAAARADSIRRDSARADSIRADSTNADSLGLASLVPLVPANPADSGRAAVYGVELLSANTEDGATMRLRDGGSSYPAATVAPVLTPADRSQWYKVVIGAYASRAGADSMLARLRAERQLAPGSGAVVRVPFAFLLDSSVARLNAPALVVDYVTRGVPAYSLMQRDGTARVYVGAFASPDDASLLAARLRARNIHATLVYRVGSPS